MLSRYTHRLLRRNHSKKIPTRCLYMDVETKHIVDGEYERHRLKLGWTCYVRYNQNLTVSREHWYEWKQTYPLNTYIMSQAPINTHLWLFGHNIFFDLQSSDFFHYFTKWGWELDFYYEQGLTYILVIKHKTLKSEEELKRMKGKVTNYTKYKWRHISIISTTNYYSTSLRKIGNMLGFEKGEVDFETATDEELSKYCKRDVDITRKAMEYYYEFIKKHDLGKFSFTKSSQSFRAYRHRFMKTNIYFHDSKEARKLERDAYYGGRTECFRVGNIKGGPFLTLDVNSMYPHVMRFNPMPIQLLKYTESPSIRNLDITLKKFAVVAEVEVDTDTPLYPYRHNNKLIFPVGRFRTNLCTIGLREAIARGHLVDVHRMAIYRKAVIFQEFVDYLYELKLKYKKEDNIIMTTLTKYILNSLYGKWGQRKPVLKESKEITFDGYYRQITYIFPEGLQGIEYKMFNKHIWQVGIEDSPNSFTAISAHITEAARFLLWNIIEDIGVDKVFYCDTDSIKIRKKDLKYLDYPLHDTNLGALKVEEETNKLFILGPKSYITEKQRKIKGVPMKARKVGKFKYRYTEFLRQASHMEKQVTRYYLIKHTVKKASPGYDKGTVNRDGTITPFRIESL